MEPEIRTVAEKKLVGKRLSMSFTNNLTQQLWQSFMPVKKEITGVMGADLYSLQNYPPGFFTPFNPAATFEKWATVEVAGFKKLPPGLETLILPAGLYAVFIHKGPASEGAGTFQYIFQTWLPASGYELDDRPHFEVMGAKYKNDEQDSEEEVWIPVRSVL